MSSGIVPPGTMCCICFATISRATCFECAKCNTAWDMCQNCGPREGCLNCDQPPAVADTPAQTGGEGGGVG